METAFWTSRRPTATGNGDGTFRAPVSYAAGIRPYALASGDFNGDGRLDLAVGSSGDIRSKQPETVAILLGRGDGAFEAARFVSLGSQTPATSSLGSLAAGDLNGDGKLDLAVTASAADGSATIAILTGAGDGTFQVASYPAGAGVRSVAIADIDGDSRPDVLIAHCCGAGDTSYMRGNADGTLQPEAHFPGGAAPIWMTISDFNGDGKPDVAVANNLDQGVVAILSNRLLTPVAPVDPAPPADPGPVDPPADQSTPPE
jgi:hypothetical protein